MPSHDGPSLLEALGLQHSFGQVPVLRGLDLSIGEGEALVVVGPNGAGKTTLLRILAGLARPSSGRIRVLGQPLERGSSQTRRAIGLLSHQSLLYDDLTLAENLTFVARLYGLSQPRRAAEASLAAAGLGDRADDLPRQLSRGLLQRAAIIRASLHQPKVLLLDEPFTSLDPAAADRLRADLRGKLAEGLGLVLVTHHLTEVWELASKVAVLLNGRWALNEPRVGPVEAFLPRYYGLIGA
jgi:heme exporter protein A